MATWHTSVGPILKMRRLRVPRRKSQKNTILNTVLPHCKVHDFNHYNIPYPPKKCVGAVWIHARLCWRMPMWVCVCLCVCKILFLLQHKICYMWLKSTNLKKWHKNVCSFPWFKTLRASENTWNYLAYGKQTDRQTKNPEQNLPGCFFPSVVH